MINYGLDQVPDPSARGKLESLIRQLMPRGSEDDIQAVLNELYKTIDYYRLTFPILEDGRRKRSSLKEGRAELQAIADGPDHEMMPRNLLAKKTLLQQRPIGHRKQELAKSFLAKKALATLAARADHEPDEYRELFAYEVALVAQNQMGLKVAMTRDDPTCDQPTAIGAAYARLLRATLKAAGAEPPDDLLPLMRVGSKLLRALES